MQVISNVSIVFRIFVVEFNRPLDATLNNNLPRVMLDTFVDAIEIVSFCKTLSPFDLGLDECDTWLVHIVRYVNKLTKLEDLWIGLNALDDEWERHWSSLWPTFLRTWKTPKDVFPVRMENNRPFSSMTTSFVAAILFVNRAARINFESFRLPTFPSQA